MGNLSNELLWQVIKRLVEKWNCLPRVLAIPVFTLSEKMCEILFSCSGLTRMMIRMFHRVWIATWMLEDVTMHFCSAPAFSVWLYSFVRVTHLFKADVCDVPQDAFHRVSPLPLSQRILLSPDDIKVMRDVIRRVVLRLPLALTLKPRADVVGRTGVSCRFIKNIWLRCYVIYPEIKIHSKRVRRQRCYPCSRCPQTPWSCPVQAFHCVCSSFAEVVGRTPPFSGEAVQQSSQNEGI